MLSLVGTISFNAVSRGYHWAGAWYPMERLVSSVGRSNCRFEVILEEEDVRFGFVDFVVLPSKTLLHVSTATDAVNPAVVPV